MFPKEVTQEGRLPSPEERREILEHARHVLVEARTMMQWLDQTEGIMPIGAMLAEQAQTNPLLVEDLRGWQGTNLVAA